VRRLWRLETAVGGKIPPKADAAVVFQVVSRGKAERKEKPSEVVRVNCSKGCQLDISICFTPFILSCTLFIRIIQIKCAIWL
jgi:hypothetical protein